MSQLVNLVAFFCLIYAPVDAELPPETPLNWQALYGLCWLHDLTEKDFWPVWHEHSWWAGVRYFRSWYPVAAQVPPLSELYLLPTPAEVKQRLEFLRRHRCWLATQKTFLLPTEEAAWCEHKLRTEQLFALHEEMSEAHKIRNDVAHWLNPQTYHYLPHRLARRIALYHVRQAVGYQNYYAGKFPAPAPLEFFRRY